MTPWLLRHNTGVLAGDADSSANKICEVAGGFITLAGYDHPTITKVDYLGGTEWQRTDSVVGWGNLVADPAGGALYLSDGALTKFNTDGSVAWRSWPGGSLPSNPGVTPYYYAGTSTYFVNSVSGNLIYVDALTSTGAVSYQKLYTGETDEVAAFGSQFLINADSLFLATKVTTGDDYFKVTKLTSGLAVTWAKSYKVSGSVMNIISRCMLASGKVLVAYLVGTPTATLRLVAIDSDGIVSWSKSVTDSAIADYDVNWVEVTAASSGFFVQTLSDTGRIVLYKFDDTGALEWSIAVRNPSYSGGYYGYSAFNSSTGEVVFCADLVDSSAHTIGSFFSVRSDGTPLGNYASGTAEITAHTTASVAAGATVTAASTTAGTFGASTYPATLFPVSTLSASDYELTLYGNDLLQVKQAAGTKEVFHGTANSPYLQSKVATGTSETKHGVAVSVQGLPEGATLCTATGTKEVFHGSAVGKSPFASAASGTLETKHGTAISRMSCTATGKLSVAYGTAKGAVIGQATGSKNTKYGLAKTLLPGTAFGTMQTKHGQAVSDWGNVGVATGRLTAKHGTASSKSVFKATGSFKTRYGTAKVVRSLTC